MAHMRQQIREGAEGLINAIANINTVYSSRVRTVDDDQLPVAIISTPIEQLADTGEAIGDSARVRILTLVVDIHAKGKLMDDVLDALAVDVEKALASDATLGGFAINSELEETECEFDASTDNDVGRLTMTYQVMYRTDKNDPELIVN